MWDQGPCSIETDGNDFTAILKDDINSCMATFQRAMAHSDSQLFSPATFRPHLQTT
jgi:hypothetical protein